MKKQLLPLCALTLAFLAGCGRPANPASAPAAEAKTKGTIGVSLLTLDNPFFKVIGDNIAAEGKKRGYDAIIRHSKGETLPAQMLIPTSLYRKADAMKDPELK